MKCPVPVWDRWHLSPGSLLSDLLRNNAPVIVPTPSCIIYFSISTGLFHSKQNVFYSLQFKKNKKKKKAHLPRTHILSSSQLVLQFRFVTKLPESYTYVYITYTYQLHFLTLCVFFHLLHSGLSFRLLGPFTLLGFLLPSQSRELLPISKCCSVPRLRSTFLFCLHSLPRWLHPIPWPWITLKTPKCTSSVPSLPWAYTHTSD